MKVLTVTTEDGCVDCASDAKTVSGKTVRGLAFAGKDRERKQDSYAVYHNNLFFHAQMEEDYL